MSEVFVRIPKDLEEDIKEFHVKWDEIALEAIRLKAFELKLERSAEFRRTFVEAIASKSRLSEEEADEFAVKLGRRIKKGRFGQLRKAGVL
ncbi:MAG: hypothetical protein JW724_07135 [Candidatus Altiarchaeota archaeon]|nr:hypothetical protein [Candidatus Altiarchaeota archaeon]